MSNDTNPTPPSTNTNLPAQSAQGGNLHSFHKKRSPVLAFLMIVLLAGGLFAGLILTQRQQEMRSKASSSDVIVQLVSSKKRVQVDEEFQVSASMTTREHKVTAADLVIQYPAEYFKLLESKPGKALPTLIAQKNATNSAELIVVLDCTKQCTPHKGTGEVGQFRFKARKESAKPLVIKISNKTSIASIGNNENIPGDFKNETITIGAPITPTLGDRTDYTLFSRPIFSDQPILPATNPYTSSPQEILRPGEFLRLFSARGEEESTSAAIFNDGTLPLKKINVQVSSLTHVTDQTKTLPGAEIRSVKVIRYREKWRQENAEPSVIYPAVLVPYTQKHVDAGEFNVPVGKSKEWWITVRIPDTAAPGVYAGTITIDPGEPLNAPTTTIPIQITVSGAMLLTSSQISGFYYKPPNDYLDCTKDPCTSVKPYDYADIATLPRFREITSDNFALMKRMGMQTVVPVVAPLILLWNETLTRVDFNLAFLETVLDEAKQAGLASYPIPIYQATNFILYKGIRKKYRNNGTFTSDQLDQLANGDYKRAIQAMDALAKAKQITLYYYPSDEPFHHILGTPPVPEELAWLKKSVPLIRSAVPGAQVWTTISFTDWFNSTTSAQLRTEFNPFIDIQAYSAGIGKTYVLSIIGKTQIRDHLRDSGDIGYTYFNQYLGTPYDHRTEHGLFLWNLPLKGNTPWIFQSICKDPYQDELGCSINRGDWLYSYPDPYDNYKLLPALNLYGVREGVDDNRYLYTLKEAIRQSTDTTKKQEAQTFLNQIDQAINRTTPNISNIKERVPSYKLDTWRKQAAKLILELGQPVPPTPTATPTPTPPDNFIEGDLDRDGDVDIFDYNLLVADFGKTGVSGFVPADINKNGEVEIFDYNILVVNFGRKR